MERALGYLASSFPSIPAKTSSIHLTGRVACRLGEFRHRLGLPVRLNLLEQFAGAPRVRA